MAKFNAASARKLVFQLHLWVSLILFIPLVMLGLTGSALMFPEQVNALTNPVPQVASDAQVQKSVAQYLEAGRAALPAGARVTGVRLPVEPGTPVAVQASTGAPGPGGGRTAWLDPATGAVLKMGHSSSWVFAFSHDFHGFFLILGSGRQLVGWAGVLMTFLAFTGLWLWWPRGGFGKAFRWKRTPDTMNNLHHLFGFWMSIPLAVISLTGVFISFPSLTNAVFPAPAASGPRPGGPPSARPAPQRKTPDEAVALAKGALPNGQLVAVTLPGQGGGRGPAAGPRNAWRVEFSDAGARKTLLVDDATGAVQAAPPQGPRPGPDGSPRSMIRPLHEGLVGGAIWKWIVFAAGLLPTLMAFTGIWLWVRNESRKARSRTAASA